MTKAWINYKEPLGKFECSFIVPNPVYFLCHIARPWFNFKMPARKPFLKVFSIGILVSAETSKKKIYNSCGSLITIHNSSQPL